MALDAICLAAVVRELRTAVEGGRIDKIFQPGKRDIVLAVHGRAGNIRILISADPSHPRVHLTTLERENPEQPPMFCMLLRKYLSGARIAEITQPEMERAVRFTFNGENEYGEQIDCALVLECVGRNANLLLLDRDERIIDCIRRASGDAASGERQLLPGYPYRTMMPHPGIPPLIERELRFRGETGDLALKLRELWEMAQAGTTHPVMLLREGKPVDFSFFPTLQYGPETELREYPTYGALLDEFYEIRERQERMRQWGDDLLRTLKTARERTIRKMENQKRELAATQERERLRQLGDILTSNMYQLEKGRSTVRLPDYYDPENREVEIRIDPRLTPQQNAAKYYKDYTKAKNAEIFLTEQLRNGERDLVYLDSVLEMLTLAEGERDIVEIRRELAETGYLRFGGKARRGKTVAARPMEFRTDAGLRVSVGKNNTQNDRLTFKQAAKNDWWFHVQSLHGAHVILFTDGSEPDELSVTQAATLAAWFSQGREAGKLLVDYTPVKYIKKPAGAKPGMVIYTTYHTIAVCPDEELAKRLRVTFA